ncbi:MAG: hypothetical protein WB239_05055 [Acidimicrobiia bacterium]
MRIRIVIAVAALLLIGGGSLVAVAQATETTDTTTATNPAEGRVLDGPISAVLDDLVSQGVITADQSSAITDALVAKREELAAERRQRLQDWRQHVSQIRGFLDDGVITSDELSQLPESSPLRDPDGPLADALGDGQITSQELRDARIFLRGFERGHRRGLLQGSTSGA